MQPRLRRLKARKNLKLKNLKRNLRKLPRGGPAQRQMIQPAHYSRLKANVPPSNQRAQLQHLQISRNQPFQRLNQNRAPLQATASPWSRFRPSNRRIATADFCFDTENGQQLLAFFIYRLLGTVYG
jgi:hypothetical protein